MEHTIIDLIWYLMAYSLLGWVLEVCIYAVSNRQFVNRGLLNLPISLPWGLTSAALTLVLPTLQNPVSQFLMAIAVYGFIRVLCSQFVRRVSGITTNMTPAFPEALLMALGAGTVLIVQDLLIHPMLVGLISALPNWLKLPGAAIFPVLLAADYFCVRHTLRTHQLSPTTVRHLQGTQRIADRLTDAIWNRLHRAYPGIQEEPRHNITFADGLCFDKLFWVFLISSVLGALIEMVFCRVTGGVWMNRSSLLYGPFSVVWGLGAVVLTVVLQRMEDKPDRIIFLGGCILGGVYEYLCSVFTEYVFGTVFWDYSNMPLNLGGRINLLYCIFWGLLAVLWLRVLYPPMDRFIEKWPVLAGKVLTWTLALLMLCNAALTCGAMLRYTERQTNPQTGAVGTLLDERYPDDFMETRWPNMMIR